MPDSTSALINQLTNPPNPLQQFGGTIDLANKFKQFQADKAIADIYGQSIDPTTGLVDPNKFGILAQGNPAALWHYGLSQRQMGEGMQAQGSGTSAQVQAAQDQLGAQAAYMQPLIAKAQNGTVTADDVRSVLNNMPPGLVSPTLITNFERQMANGADPNNWVKGAFFANQHGREILNQAQGPLATINQGGQITFARPGAPFAPGGVSSGPFPTGLSPEQWATEVTIDTPNGPIKRRLGDLLGIPAPAGVGGKSYAPGPQSGGGGAPTGSVGGGKGGALGPQSSAGGIGAGQLYSFLIENGATKNEATMLTSAANSESSFRPDISHDGGIGYGLFGHNAERLAAMRQFADVGPNDPVPWQQQAAFALQELRSRPEGALVNSATTPDQLTDAQLQFERPNLNIAGGNRAQRLASTTEYWNKPPAAPKPTQVASLPPTTATDAQPANPYAGTGGQGTYVPPGGTAPRNIATGQPAPAGGVVPQPPGPGQPTNINQPTPPVGAPTIGLPPVSVSAPAPSAPTPPVQVAQAGGAPQIPGGPLTSRDIQGIPYEQPQLALGTKDYTESMETDKTLGTRTKPLINAIQLLRNNPATPVGPAAKDWTAWQTALHDVFGVDVSTQGATTYQELAKQLAQNAVVQNMASQTDLDRLNHAAAQPNPEQSRDAILTLAAEQIGLERIKSAQYRYFRSLHPGKYPATDSPEKNTQYFNMETADWAADQDPMAYGLDYAPQKAINDYLNGLDKNATTKFGNSVNNARTLLKMKVPTAPVQGQ